MSAHGFQDLSRHIGHHLECVGYSLGGEPPYVNVAVECVTCCEVIVDFDQDDSEED